MNLKQLREEYLELNSKLMIIMLDIEQAQTLAIMTSKYTDVGKLQQLKEWRGILQGQLITNQNKQYRLRKEAKK